MRLTWRDAVGTLITGAGILAAIASLQGWGWPLLADARAGVITLLAMSLVVCPIGFASPSPSFYKDPFVIGAMIIGTAVLIVGVVALFTTPAVYLPAMIGLVAGVWLVTTVHHALGTATPARTAAPSA